MIEAIGEKVDLRPPTVDVDAEKGTSRFIVQDLEGKNDIVIVKFHKQCIRIFIYGRIDVLLVIITKVGYVAWI